MNEQKFLIAIHEAGHAVMSLAWDLRWLHAEMVIHNGIWSGAVSWDLKKYQEATEGREGFLRDWGITMAGLFAQEFHLKRLLHPEDKEFAIAIVDLDKASALIQKYIDPNHYDEFVKTFSHLSTKILIANWESVKVIANELYQKNWTTSGRIRPLIDKPTSPPKHVITKHMADTVWKV